MQLFSKHYGCPVECTVSLLNGKWKTVILAWIKEKPHRYNELKNRIPNISDKVLTQRLKDLEELNLITKTKDEGSAGNVAYHLTSFGETLRPVLDALYNWGINAEALYENPQSHAHKQTGQSNRGSDPT